MPSKTKTALAALFILGPVAVVVLAGPNNRTDDQGSVRAVSVPHVHRSRRRRQSCREAPRWRGEALAKREMLLVGAMRHHQR